MTVILVNYILTEMLIERSVSSVAESSLILCDPMNCSTPGFPVLYNSQSLPKLMYIELVMPSNHLILCCNREVVS